MHPDLSNSLLSCLREGVHMYVFSVCVCLLSVCVNVTGCVYV